MPVITVTLSSLPAETKTSLVSALTTAAAVVTHLPESHFIVLIQELPGDAIGVGGRTLQAMQEDSA